MSLNYFYNLPEDLQNYIKDISVKRVFQDTLKDVLNIDYQYNINEYNIDSDSLFKVSRRFKTVRKIVSYRWCTRSGLLFITNLIKNINQPQENMILANLVTCEYTMK